MRRAVVLAVALVGSGCDPASPPTKKSIDDYPELTTPVPHTPPLKAGDTLPPIVARGWLNGPQPAVGAPGQKLLVVDAWAHWCPSCRTTAPDLVKLHEKYAPRGVQFVGMSNMTEDMVTTYVGSSRIPWPTAYLLNTESIARLGISSGMPGPGYQVAPTLLLVGPDGVIRWTDQRMRAQQPPPADWHKRVEAAIVEQLDGPAPAGR